MYVAVIVYSIMRVLRLAVINTVRVTTCVYCTHQNVTTLCLTNRTHYVLYIHYYMCVCGSRAVSPTLLENEMLTCMQKI